VQPDEDRPADRAGIDEPLGLGVRGVEDLVMGHAEGDARDGRGVDHLLAFHRHQARGARLPDRDRVDLAGLAEPDQPDGARSRRRVGTHGWACYRPATATASISTSWSG
jgi:hypothetical protein